MEQILINCTTRETRVAIVVDGVLQDLFIERACAKGLVGNVYWGKVVRVLPGMQSAFVDVGLERTAFLHVADMPEAHGEAGQNTPIEKILHEGQSLMVQVAKDPIGTKGARLTTSISLAGRKLVYLPRDPHIGISQRIEDEAVRDNLRRMIGKLRRDDDKGGYIVRTCAGCSVGEEEFAEDMAYLGRLWSRIVEQTTMQPAPFALYEELTLAQRVLRDMVGQQTERVEIDRADDFEVLRKFAERYVPAVKDRLVLYSGERSLFARYSVDSEIDTALGRRVDLKSGGYLVFDQTEAMSTIDVNTGGYVGKRNFSDTVFKTNLEAAQTIARQLRLRNLGGIIIIDFIDMCCDDHREAVMAELRRAVAQDRTRTTISNFTELGLVEMTRKRTRESLSQVLCEPCPVCHGRGQVRTARTVCYDIMREVGRLSRQYAETKEFTVIAAPKTIDMFLAEEAQAFELLQTLVEKPIRLSVEPAYSQEQYDVVLA